MLLALAQNRSLTFPRLSARPLAAVTAGASPKESDPLDEQKQPAGAGHLFALAGLRQQLGGVRILDGRGIPQWPNFGQVWATV